MDRPTKIAMNTIVCHAGAMSTRLARRGARVTSAVIGSCRRGAIISSLPLLHILDCRFNNRKHPKRKMANFAQVGFCVWRHPVLAHWLFGALLQSKANQ